MSPNAQCSPVILVCCAHHLAAWREVTDKWTWLASPSSSIQYSVPVKWLTRRLRGRHPAQVAAAVEAGLLEIGVLHTSKDRKKCLFLTQFIGNYWLWIHERGFSIELKPHLFIFDGVNLFPEFLCDRRRIRYLSTFLALKPPQAMAGPGTNEVNWIIDQINLTREDSQVVIESNLYQIMTGAGW